MKKQWTQGLFFTFISIALLLTTLPVPVHAAIPQQINYQGYITDPQGTAIDATVSIVFSIYSQASGGTVLWTETKNVTITDGLFSVNLGEGTPITLSFDTQYYLGITVGSDKEMTPRQPITSVGYAFRAQEADSVKDNAVTTKVIANNAVTTNKVEDDAITGDKIAPTTITSTNIANGAVTSSQIGDASIATGDLANDAVTAAKIKPNIISSIGGVTNDGGNVDLVAGSNVTITPDDSADTITIASTGGGGSVQAPLQLSGEISGSAVIQAINTGSGDGPGVRGRSDNDNGVVGWTGASEMSGVFGNSQLGSGVTGRSEAASGYGVAGRATGSDGVGVYGNGTTGVSGESHNGSGVEGSSTSSTHAGVYGHSTVGNGVKGRSDNNDGVVGWTGASEKSGVFGHSQVGAGVSGRSDGNNGVLATTTSNNPDHAGLWAHNAGGSGGPAIYCEGDLFVTGEFRGAKGSHGGAPFPRPAYDSGWISIAQWQHLVLQHGVGGSVDNYFIDFQERQWGYITNEDIGGFSYFTPSDDMLSYGANYTLLSNQEIKVYNRKNSDVDKVRVRIWIYN